MTVKVTVAKCELCGCRPALLLGANYILFNTIIIIRHKPKLYQQRIYMHRGYLYGHKLI